jgi:glutathione S-transferase
VTGLRFVILATVLAAIEVMVFAMLVGRARGTYGVAAPAMSGHPAWERLNRVHQNSVEQLVVFIPLLWAFAGSVSQFWGGVLGFVFVIARIVYAVGYARDAGQRAAGAIATAVVLWLLGIGAVVGYVTQIIRS